MDVFVCYVIYLVPLNLRKLWSREYRDEAILGIIFQSGLRLQKILLLQAFKVKENTIRKIAFNISRI